MHDLKFVSNQVTRSAPTWLAGWLTGGGCFESTTEGSVSPLVCTISVGPLEALFSIMGIRSRRAGLKSVNRRALRREKSKNHLIHKRVQRGCDYLIERKAVSPHVVVFLEKRIVLHRPLLKLHVDAAAVYRNHLLDSAGTEFYIL